MNVGRISELWRYPVKSMAGESIDSATFDTFGMIGDRAWSTINSETGDVGWGKSYPGLLNLKARYSEQAPTSRVYCEDVPPVAIEFPDGGVVGSDSNADAALSEYIGAPLRLNPLEPPENLEHYRWQTPVDYEAILKILGIGPDEPPPDMGAYDGSIIEMLAQYYAPPGTYHDMFPVHALTTSSIEHMQSQSGEAFDLKRFRPNFLIETAPGIEGLVEFEWIGKTLKIGECLLKVEAKTIRCSMPPRGQAPYGLEQNAKIAKSLFTETGRFFGAYLAVAQAGAINVGDEVVLLD
jgi:MOSC domain-containing protein